MLYSAFLRGFDRFYDYIFHLAWSILVEGQQAVWVHLSRHDLKRFLYTAFSRRPQCEQDALEGITWFGNLWHVRLRLLVSTHLR